MWASVIQPPGAKGCRPLIGGQEGEFGGGLGKAAVWATHKDHVLPNAQHEEIHEAIGIDVDGIGTCGGADVGQGVGDEGEIALIDK